MNPEPPQLPVFDLTCPPRTDLLAMIRGVVTAVSREVGFSPDDISLIEISVDEACTNVIRHAYEDSGGTGTDWPASEPRIKIEIRPSPDALAISVIDWGLQPSCPPPKGVGSVEEYAAQSQPKGLGSFIIAQFMDQVAYNSPPGLGTVLSMVKYLRRSDGR